MNQMVSKVENYCDNPQWPNSSFLPFSLLKENNFFLSCPHQMDCLGVGGVGAAL